MEGKESEIGEALHYLIKNKESLSQSQANFLGQLSESAKDKSSQADDPIYKL